MKETQEELGEEAAKKMNRINELGEQIGTKLSKAEEAGNTGEVEQSMALLREVEELKAKKYAWIIQCPDSDLLIRSLHLDH